MDFSSINSKANYRFIVVYDKLTKKVAAALRNEAVNQKISSVIWDKKLYITHEPELTNYNHILFLNEDLINENLSDPNLKPIDLVPGFYYKKQGNQVGIFPKNNTNWEKVATEMASMFKENWGKFLIVQIAGGLIGSSILAVILAFSRNRKAKLYMYFKAIDEFRKKYLMDFVAEKKTM